MTALHDLSAVELLARYRERSLSPVEVARAVLDRIAAWEPHLHATYALDPDAALAAARVAESRWLRHVSAGENVGALEGVPTMIKENIATAGTPVPLGTAATELVPAGRDAPPAASAASGSSAYVACRCGSHAAMRSSTARVTSTGESDRSR